jgi:acyl-CoA synthetase (AMP-forming)/AMP-acid ligase II/thioesterase domain-containing protein
MGASRSNHNVYDRFVAIAEAHASDVAFAEGGSSISYSDLAARAAAVRSAVLAAGTATAGFVGILTDDRASALVAMLATAGSGHAYVLLDVNDPDKRLAHIIGEVRPFALLADAALFERARQLAGDTARALNLGKLDSAQQPDPAGPPVLPDSLLYVSFTSGSTGEPKGVCQTHRNLCFYVDAYIDAMEIGPRVPISWLFAHGASASNMDIYGALFTGARLCAFDVKTQSFAALASWIDEQGIVLLHTVPTVIRELCGIADRGTFDSVRVVDLAGEMLFPGDVARMRPYFRQDCRILNRLAATEASFIASLDVTQGHDGGEGALPVGKPPQGVEIAIVREDGAPADIGETGNIAIMSPHICTGYLNRPDLNRAIFSDVSDRPGWRRYLSADLGFIDESENLNFIGRSGSRIKLRGQAVDLAEVEAALYECAGVTGAVVIPRGDAGGEAQEILAYLTTNSDAANDGSDIRKQLATSLPAYMLPSGYVFLDAFPYTATSKVDRNALAALDLDEVRFRPGYVPPEDWLEERVTAIFSEVLDQASVGRLDDFFLLGGDSLALVNLQILATEAFGRQFAELHEDATVAGVADWLRHTESGDEISAPILLPIRTAGSSPPLFVVHGRRGQAHVGPYFLDLLGDDQPLYALQARGLDGKQEPHRSIEAMAEEYVAAIKTVQPEGPYFIGGFCAGCYIALEMIRLLFREGELYYAPLLIDPPRPNFTNGSDDLSETVLLRKMERRVRSGEWKVELHNTRAVDAAVKVARAIEDALFAYEPQIIRVPSLVIATVRRWGTIAEVKKIFGDQSGVILVEGRHADMLDPKNAQFARAVRRCIAYVSERHRKNLERPKESADDIRNRRGLPAASQAV